MRADIRKILFSSKEHSWTTPQDFFDRLDSVFKFKLDPCAMPETAKCKTYFTKEDDGLKQDWSRYDAVFVNPPYGRNLRLWCKKCHDEASNGNTIVMLIPARTDTLYWHKYCFKSMAILFIKRRLRFSNPNKLVHELRPAPFPSVLVVFGKVRKRQLLQLSDLGVWFRISNDHGDFLYEGR